MMLGVIRRVSRLRAGRMLAGSLLVALAAANAGAAAELRASIRVEGNHRVEAATIRSYIHSDHGKVSPDQADLDAGLKALYATRLFERVDISRSEDAIIVRVVENPVIRRLAFEGNRKIKEEQLQKETESRAGGPLWRPIVQQDVERVVEAYRHSGYFDATVTPKVIAAPEHQVDLVFEVKENKKVGIARLVFVGNKAYGADRLRAVIKTGTTNFLSFLLNNDIYDSDRIASDRDDLRRFYLKHGYADIRVAAAATFDPARNGFQVTFTVDEGNQYRFGTIDIRSDVPGVDATALRGKLRTDAGSVFNAEAIDRSVEDLALEAARLGHPFAAIHPGDKRDAARHVIDLVYAIEPGPRVYVERIDIRGNSKTRDDVIRRELDFGEGDAYNRSLVERAERRLKGLGYFKTVKMSQTPGSTPDRVVVAVNVEEEKTGDFTVSLGYGQADGWIGEIGIGDRNVLGTGVAAKISASYGQYTRGFDLAFTEPYALDSRASIGTDLYAKQTLASSYQSYGADTYGATLKLGTPLTDDLGAQWRYQIYNQQVTLNPSVTNASIPIQQAALAGPTWVSSIGSTINYNTLDNIRLPTQGISASLNQDIAGLGGDVNFLRTTADVRAYQPIAGDLVGMARLQGGTIAPWGGQTLPLLNGFFGGPQLVRGFAPNGFGPRDLTPGSTMDNVGGTQYWATTAELQAPVPLVPPEAGLRASFFTDAGSVWGYGGTGSTPALSRSLQVADSRAVRAAFGTGLIWDSPFGPIRADYAIPFAKTGYDVTQRFSFHAGGF
jgi:outer membrane protein insertion porin family